MTDIKTEEDKNEVKEMVSRPDYDPWIGSFVLYCREVAQIEVLSEKEEKELMKQIVEGSKSARERLTMGYSRYVPLFANYFCKRYYIKEGWDFTFFLDVVQEGNLELVRFINQYDPKSSIDFRQMAFWSISKAICNALGREEIEFKKRGESIEQLMKKLTEDREN